MAPGEIREGTLVGTDNCTTGSWKLNQFIEDHNTFWEFIERGGQVDFSVEFIRVSYDDGTGVGEAI